MFPKILQRGKDPFKISRAKSKAELEAISERNQVNSPFLRLPSEIRNHIYDLALGGHEIYAMPSGLRSWVCMGRPKSRFAWNLKPIAQIMALHLPLVCRQIRFETGKYFAFASNSFGSTMPRYFELLMATLTVEQKRSIEVVRINYVYHAEEGVAKHDLEYAELYELRNLKKMVLRDMSDMSGGEEADARKRFQAMALKKDLHVEILKIC